MQEIYDNSSRVVRFYISIKLCFKFFICFLKGYNCEKLQLFFAVKSLLSFDLFVRLFTLNVYYIYSIGDHCYHFI